MTVDYLISILEITSVVSYLKPDLSQEGDAFSTEFFIRNYTHLLSIYPLTPRGETCQILLVNCVLGHLRSEWVVVKNYVPSIKPMTPGSKTTHSNVTEE